MENDSLLNRVRYRVYDSLRVPYNVNLFRLAVSGLALGSLVFTLLITAIPVSKQLNEVMALLPLASYVIICGAAGILFLLTIYETTVQLRGYVRTTKQRETPFKINQCIHCSLPTIGVTIEKVTWTLGFLFTILLTYVHLQSTTTVEKQVLWPTFPSVIVFTSLVCLTVVLIREGLNMYHYKTQDHSQTKSQHTPIQYGGLITAVSVFSIGILFIASFAPVITAATTGPPTSDLPDGYDRVMTSDEIYSQHGSNFREFYNIYDGQQFAVEQYYLPNGGEPQVSQDFVDPLNLETQLHTGVQSLIVYGDAPAIEEPNKYQFSHGGNTDPRRHTAVQNGVAAVYHNPINESLNTHPVQTYHHTNNYAKTAFINFHSNSDTVRVNPSITKSNKPMGVTLAGEYTRVEAGYGSTDKRSYAVNRPLTHPLPGLYTATGKTTYQGEPVIVYKGVIDSLPEIADLRTAAASHPDPAKTARGIEPHLTRIQTQETRKIYVHAETGKIMKRQDDLGQVKIGFSVTPSNYNLTRPDSLAQFSPRHDPRSLGLSIVNSPPRGVWSDKPGTLFQIGLHGGSIHDSYRIEYVTPNGTRYTGDNILAGGGLAVITTEENGLVPMYESGHASDTVPSFTPTQTGYDWFTEQLGVASNSVTPTRVNPHGTLRLFADGSVVEEFHINQTTMEPSDIDTYRDVIYKPEVVPGCEVTTTDDTVSVTVYGVSLDNYESLVVKYGDTLKEQSYSDIRQRREHNKSPAGKFTFNRQSTHDVISISTELQSTNQDEIPFTKRDAYSVLLPEPVNTTSCRP